MAEAVTNRIIKPYRRISCEEIEERWSKGLCMFCDEPETPDHHRKHKNLEIFMVECDEDQNRNDKDLEELEVETEVETISIGKMASQLQLQEEPQSSDARSEENLVQKAILREELIPQFQVPVSNLKPSLRFHNASPAVGEDSQYVVGFDDLFGHQEVILPVSYVKARDVLLKKSIYVANKQVAHQLFNTMPIRVRSKKRKVSKTWRFKFKTLRSRFLQRGRI